MTPASKVMALNFGGNSFACDARGKIITCCSANENASTIVEIDYQESEQQRLVWPYFRDRRIDAYDNINKRSID